VIAALFFVVGAVLLAAGLVMVSAAIRVGFVALGATWN
jgi:hypothetical protein